MTKSRRDKEQNLMPLHWQKKNRRQRQRQERARIITHEATELHKNTSTYVQAKGIQSHNNIDDGNGDGNGTATTQCCLFFSFVALF